MKIEDIWVSQRSLRRVNQIPNLVRSIINQEDIPKIILVNCEDFEIQLHDGHHRLLAYWLAGRSTLNKKEYILLERDRYFRSRCGKIKDLAMTKTFNKGWDHFTADPGTKTEEMTCRVCGSALQCQKNIQGATSYTEAIGGKTHLHDCFCCPNTGELWHTQVLMLKKLAEETPSAKWAEMLFQEAEEIIITRKHTK